MTISIYNEIDPFAVRWLRNLVSAGNISPGVVDDRSIAELAPADVAGPGQRHFFAGIAGWSLALRLAGVPDDADVWTGSCPCQSLSDAGKRRGFADERHLWPEWFRLIRECRPAVVFGEQVASGLGWAWLDLVFTDMEGAGYACAAANLPAAGVGAPHRRQRLLFVAYLLGNASCERAGRNARAGRRTETSSSGARVEHRAVGDRAVASGADGSLANAEASGRGAGRLHRAHGRSTVEPDGYRHDGWSACDWIPCSDGVSRPVEPGTHPLAHGVPGRVGLLRGYGNAIVPQVAATFIRAALEAA